jgi:hypothetical protein
MLSTFALKCLGVVGLAGYFQGLAGLAFCVEWMRAGRESSLRNFLAGTQ